MKGVWFAVVAIWLSVAIGVSVTVYVTHSAWSLLAFLIPACMSIKTPGDDEEE